MADKHDMQDAKNYDLDVPPTCSAFPLKGSNSLVRGDETPEKALDLYHSLKSMEERSQYAK